MASKSRVALIFCTIWLCWTSSTSTCTRVWGGQRQRLQWNIGLSTKSWSEWWSFVRQRDNWRLGAGKTGTHCGRNIAVVIMWVYSFCHTRNICGGHKKCFWKSSETFLVSARRATLLPRFATGEQHRRTKGWRHNVSSFCRGLSPLSERVAEGSTREMSSFSFWRLVCFIHANYGRWWWCRHWQQLLVWWRSTTIVLIGMLTTITEVRWWLR